MSYLRDLIAVGPFPYFSFIYFFFLSMYRVVLLRTKYKSGNLEDLGMTLGVAGLTLILRGGGQGLGTGDYMRGGITQSPSTRM